MEDLEFFEQVNKKMTEQEVEMEIDKIVKEYDMITFCTTIEKLDKNTKSLFLDKIKVRVGINDDIPLNDLYMILKLSQKKEIFSEEILQEIFLTSNGLNNIFDSNFDSKQRTFILLELLENAHYKYIENKCTQECAERIFKDFDIRIQNFTEILKAWKLETKKPDVAISEASRMYNYDAISKRYINFLKRYAIYRMSKYTEDFSNTTTLESINWVIQNKLDLVIGESDLYDTASVFSYFFPTDKILQVIESYVNKDGKEDEHLLEIVHAQDSKLYMINLVNVNCIKTVDAILQNLITRCVNENSEEHPNDEIIIQNYLKEISQKKDIDFSNRILDKIQSLIRLNILPESKQFLYESILKQISLNIVYPHMDKYIEYINGNLDMPDNVADEFINDVLKIGFIAGNIPIFYVEFIMKQLLDESSYYSKTLSDSVVQKIYLEFARHRVNCTLKEKTIVLINEDLPDDTLGNSIYNENVNVIEFSKKISILEPMEVISTVFHEICHLKNRENRTNDRYDYFTYLIKKEDILKSKDILFYDRNYKYMYDEICAEMYGIQMSINFVKSLLSKNELKKPEILATIKKYEEELERIISLQNEASQKKDSSNRKRLMSDMFDEVLQSDLSIIRENPIFRIEYNDDGSKKNLVEIFKDYLLICREKENRMYNYDLYRNILFQKRITKEERKELEDVRLPEDLSEITMKIVIGLKDGILGINKEEFYEELKAFERVDETITPEMRKQIDSVIKQRRCLNEQREM